MIGFGYPFRGVACWGDSGCGGNFSLKNVIIVVKYHEINVFQKSAHYLCSCSMLRPGLVSDNNSLIIGRDVQQECRQTPQAGT